MTHVRADFGKIMRMLAPWVLLAWVVAVGATWGQMDYVRDSLETGEGELESPVDQLLHLRDGLLEDLSAACPQFFGAEEAYAAYEANADDPDYVYDPNAVSTPYGFAVQGAGPSGDGDNDACPICDGCSATDQCREMYEAILAGWCYTSNAEALVRL
jgi:hypothetical protein